MAMTMPSAPNINPLNPTLYALLEHKFGDVKIANAGSAANVQRFPDPYNPGRIVKRAHWWGEYYCVHCPFCNDQGHKLWINHLYGVDYDARTGRRTDTFLARCYKNDCLAVEGRSMQLEQLIFGPGRKVIKTMAIRAGDMTPDAETLDVPGTIIPLTDLPTDHPAVNYLVGRGFDLEELTTVYRVGLCVEAVPRYRIMNNRIYIPGYFNNRLVAFQGRLTREPRHKDEPKYYTQGKKSRALYNYDLAANEKFAVIVEGCPSVWRIGRPGVALLGNTLSFWQENTIATTWAGKPVFVLLDFGADQKLEHITMQLCQHNLQLIPLIMPDERDPADYSRAELRDMLSAAAASVGANVDLSCLR